MKFFTNKIRYSILAGLAAYGTYMISIQVLGIIIGLQNCHKYAGSGTIGIVCYIFGIS
jgi:hypothetical protein